MQVLFLPYSAANPYQRELATALNDQGVHVAMRASVRPLFITDLLRRRGKLDVLHLHWTHGFMIGRSRLVSVIKLGVFIMQLLIVKALGIRIVWTAHNLVQHEREDVPFELFSHRVLVRLYDRIIVHCQYARQAVITSYKLPLHQQHKLVVIPHGNYIGSYPHQLDRAAARAQLGIAQHQVVLLYFGAIRRYKGVLHLIELFQRIEAPHARLLIAGLPVGDVTAAEVAALASRDKRITPYLIHVPDADVQRYMLAADVVVLPFQDVLVSGSVMLAISWGRPVITPQLGCVAETLDAQGSFLYDPHSDDGLLMALQRALVSDLQAMGDHNRVLAEQFDWQAIATATARAYAP